jgi:hypothetical protein
MICVRETKFSYAGDYMCEVSSQPPSIQLHRLFSPNLNYIIMYLGRNLKGKSISLDNTYATFILTVYITFRVEIRRPPRVSILGRPPSGQIELKSGEKLQLLCEVSPLSFGTKVGATGKSSG